MHRCAVAQTMPCDGRPIPADEVQGGFTEEEKRNNVIRVTFGGDRHTFDEFCRAIDDVAPPGTTVILRGSAVTGRRWKDGQPFNADGPGSSDLDLTLVGDAPSSSSSRPASSCPAFTRGR